ncbi:hypothetical protein FSP39_001469 [Pinctada imbricata]|uniref:Uncharacterized protein n=1 Tax=Pinctada imbricata TaxID=66713 RepID=A0AA88XER6_PINIB|nr:hypothetical protein FSP39_001469 [Pinctada imbricata]
MSDRAQTYVHVVPPGTRRYNSQVDTGHAPYNSPPIDYRRSSVDSRGYTRPVETRNYSTPADPAYPYRHDPRRESSDSFYNTGRRFSLHRESMMDLNDSLDPGDGYKSVYTLWGRFAEKTSMQGCAYIYTARVWYARLLWILLLLAAIGGMIFHLYYLTNQYIAFPKVTKMTLNFSNLPFPAVTICNTNIIRLSQLNKTDQVIQDLVNKTNPKKFNPKNHRNAKGFFPPPPEDVGGDIGGSMRRRKRFVDLFDNLDFDLPYPKVDDYEYFYDGDHNNAPPPRDSQSKMEKHFRYMYMSKSDRNKRIEVGHQIQDMLISCSFDGYKCYADNFTVISNEDFGNCFTLQSSFVSTKAGPRSGLSVILYMEGEEYLEGISQGYGARVVVHEQDSFPFPADRGLYLSPSYESHIGVKMTKISREGDPYGKCTDGEAYRQQYGIKYSRLVCQSLCKQNEIFKRCGCYDFISQVELIHFMHGEATEDKFCYTNERE